MNLGRIAGLATADRPDATIVDIGANVGDSVAIMRSGTVGPDPRDRGGRPASSRTSRSTLARFADVEVAPTYVRTSGSADDALAVVRDGGTARLERVTGPATAGRTTRGHPAGRHPARPSAVRLAPRLVKVDTDGQDAGILADADDGADRRPPDAVLRVRSGHDAGCVRRDALEVFPGLAAPATTGRCSSPTWAT